MGRYVCVFDPIVQYNPEMPFYGDPLNEGDLRNVIIEKHCHWMGEYWRKYWAFCKMIMPNRGVRTVGLVTIHNYTNWWDVMRCGYDNYRQTKTWVYDIHTGTHAWGTYSRSKDYIAQALEPSSILLLPAPKILI